MSLGPVMCDIAGFTLTEEDRQRLSHPQVGGVILFSRNYQNTHQLKALVDDIHALRQPRLIVAVDHEGGRVQRFREGFQKIPPMSTFGDLYESQPQQALKAAETVGWIVATELLSFGIDLSFSPVLDIGDPISQVIGDRAFHRKPEVIVRLANAWIRGMQQAGMEAVGKHFPGHGSVEGDSHHVMPFDKRDFESINKLDLIPFRQVIKTHLSGIMMAHVIYENVDASAAGYSHFWIQQCLRNNLGFEGTIFSDDLSMSGAEIAGNYAQRAKASLDAGCDMLLVCNNEAGADDVINSLKDYNNPVSQLRLIRLHGKPKIKQTVGSAQWLQALQILSELNRNTELSISEDLFNSL